MNDETKAFGLASREHGRPGAGPDRRAGQRPPGRRAVRSDAAPDLPQHQRQRAGGGLHLPAAARRPCCWVSRPNSTASARSGTIVAKREAERQYEEALAEGDAPVMLEALADGLHTANIGNLKPGDEMVLEVRFAQLLTFEQGRLRLAIPTTIAPRYGNAESAGLQPQQVPQASLLAEYPLALSVTVAGALAGGTVECPTHRFTPRGGRWRFAAGPRSRRMAGPRRGDRGEAPRAPAVARDSGARHGAAGGAGRGDGGLAAAAHDAAQTYRAQAAGGLLRFDGRRQHRFGPGRAARCAGRADRARPGQRQPLRLHRGTCARAFGLHAADAAAPEAGRGRDRRQPRWYRDGGRAEGRVRPAGAQGLRRRGRASGDRRGDLAGGGDDRRRSCQRAPRVRDRRGLVARRRCAEILGRGHRWRVRVRHARRGARSRRRPHAGPHPSAALARCPHRLGVRAPLANRAADQRVRR